MVSSTADTGTLEQIFRHKVLKMLLAKGKITRNMIDIMDKWRHTGFNAYCGPRILPRQKKSMENLARYIIRASFSQERMSYQRGGQFVLKTVKCDGQIIYSDTDQKLNAIDSIDTLSLMPRLTTTSTGPQFRRASFRAVMRGVIHTLNICYKRYEFQP